MRALLLAVIAVWLPASGATAAPVAGKDYDLVQPPQPTSDPSKIVVTEFFSYECPHCYAFAKPFAAWIARLPADVEAERVAVSIGHAAWMPAAQAFYALSAMNKVPAIDDALFGAIHRQHLDLTNETSLARWAATQGIDPGEFTAMYRSFGVGVKTKRADELSRLHRLPSVPTLVIDGKYMIRIADDGNFGDQIAVAEALIARARGERKSGR
jgi:protein dithiol oxidoreductase (disulfide-forming)